MKTAKITIVVTAILSSVALCQEISSEEASRKYLTGLQQVLTVRDRIVPVYLLLYTVYPIAIVENEQFFIFDIDSAGQRYIFVKKAPTPMPIPKGVRAAFPLDCYGNKIACVVSGEIFADPADYVTIFHEFVHCYQWETCERTLKANLEIARKAFARQDYSWEINYSFPYADSQFSEIYASFLKALQENNHSTVIKYRQQLKQILSQDDFEYLAWQEWKEGLARYIENQIRCRLNFTENHYGLQKPFHRITFYEGGARYIEFLIKQDPELATDIEKLFYKILTGDV